LAVATEVLDLSQILLVVLVVRAEAAAELVQVLALVLIQQIKVTQVVGVQQAITAAAVEVQVQLAVMDNPLAQDRLAQVVVMVLQ
jgi:hypothetical protein